MNMNVLIDLISREVSGAFEKAGFDPAYGKVTLSNRPDLCEYQCNGALPAAKVYHKAPIQIAGAVKEQLAGALMFESVEAVNPGFLNFRLSSEFLAQYIAEMNLAEHFGVQPDKAPKTIVVDYGGPNVAKPLHVGHLRSAIIGESIKRIYRFFGNHVIGDIHLGDWGLQMGLIIAQVQSEHPELCYFDPNFTGEYPEEAPFTISELEKIYPEASARSKVDAEFAEKAHNATYLLQQGERGYRAMWQQIMRVSVEDLKKNYANLNVSFDVWLGESDAQAYIPKMLEIVKDKHLAVESDGALVVPVQEETDTKEMPPCIILKSDGAALYATTDLATIVDRMENLHADSLIYLADKRQEMHFVQVFRVAKKAGLVTPETELKYVGFGTMNGKDGKPFKTREGGVMRLEYLIRDIDEEMYRKVSESRHDLSEEEARKIAKIIGLSAIKYGDLSNQASKDYIFDIDRFTSFEGDTGPYILYTIVRIKSILAKYQEQGKSLENLCLEEAQGASEKDLMRQLCSFNAMMDSACEETAPHKICAYIYDLANAFNKFYHETKILAEEDQKKQAGWIALLKLTKEVLETCIDVLGFSAPDRM